MIKAFTEVEDDGAIVAVFGHGIVGVTHYIHEKDGHGALSLYPLSKPVEIGAEFDDDIGKTTDELDERIRLVFYKKESIDVVIDRLNRGLNGHDAACYSPRFVTAVFFTGASHK